MGNMARRILEGIGKSEAKEDSGLQIYSTEPSGSMSEDDDPGFKEWLSKVNSLVAGRFGLGIYDLPDMMYRDWYDDEMTPDEAVRQVMDSLKDDYGEMGGIFDDEDEGAPAEPVDYSKPSDAESTAHDDFQGEFKRLATELKALMDAGKRGTPEWDALVTKMNELQMDYEQVASSARQDRIHAMVRSETPGPQEGCDDGDDDWASLEEMEQDCPECATKMREAGFTRIRRGMVDECRGKQATE